MPRTNRGDSADAAAAPMRTIYLVRHGKAAERTQDTDDRTRALVARGEKDSRKLGGRLAALGLEVDLLLSSPARRARETAQIFARALRYPRGRIQLDDALYDAATGSALLRTLRRLPPQVHSVMLFGHEPSLSGLAAHLLPLFDGSLPKSGVVGIHVPAGSWKQLKPGSGVLGLIEFPRARKRSRRLFRQIADAELSELVWGFLQTKDPPAAVALQDPVRWIVARLNDVFLERP